MPSLFDLNHDMVVQTGPNLALYWEALSRKLQQGPSLADVAEATQSSSTRAIEACRTRSHRALKADNE